MKFPLDNMLIKRYALFLFLFLLTAQVIIAQDDFPERPNPPKLVNDFSQTLSSSEQAALEQKLVAFNDSTSSQITVVLMGSVGQYDISDYAFQLGEKWGIGQEGKDNGLLILAAMKDRKVFIATGYGLEGAVPDALARRIVDNVIVPSFKREAYYEGLDQATTMIIKLASGEYDAEDVEKKGNSGGAIFFILIFIVIFIIIPFIKNRNDNDNHMGGRGGGVDFFTSLMLMNLLGGGNRGGGGFGNFSGGGGSFGGGGGFGGFGGGSFGGGGAGGSW
ncbi:TPM domain-containing protein [Echinicola strongylocentroti]|uniref:TPM domain-containing protein n=1 Tax=Echinicola strongylocentroti TaxID=1795355 RepID=A0A2Z4IIL5_9BACT|nr:TPM domain-containing protein [Echinicola strongylocentroti]AWW30971.1 TPM domain-containing protein [Echinicola strongylocentroti]